MLIPEHSKYVAPASHSIPMWNWVTLTNRVVIRIKWGCHLPGQFPSTWRVKLCCAGPIPVTTINQKYLRLNEGDSGIKTKHFITVIAIIIITVKMCLFTALLRHNWHCNKPHLSINICVPWWNHHRVLFSSYHIPKEGFPGGASGKEPTCQSEDVRGVGPIPESGRSPGGGHGNPLQYSCLERPRNRGAWWATVHRVAKSRTRLKQLSTHTHILYRFSIIRMYCFHIQKSWSVCMIFKGMWFGILDHSQWSVVTGLRRIQTPKDLNFIL